MKAVLFLCLLWPFVYAKERELLKAEYQIYLNQHDEEVRHGKIIVRYPDGKIYSEGYYVDGREEGEWNIWHKAGHKASEKHYQNGKLIKEAKTWHKNQQKKSLTMYDHGYKQGQSLEWYDSGKLKSQIDYKLGKLHGTYTEWYDNGQMKVQTFYQEGKLHGTYTTWDNNGVEREKKFYKLGIEMKLMVYTEKWANGQLKIAYHYFRNKNGEEIKHGRYRKWFLNGETWISCEYRFNKLHGTYTFGKPKGLNYREENYDHGQKHGKFTWYKEGKLKREELWQYDKLVHNKSFN